jgi:hypothetical protein
VHRALRATFGGLVKITRSATSRDASSNLVKHPIKPAPHLGKLDLGPGPGGALANVSPVRLGKHDGVGKERRGRGFAVHWGHPCLFDGPRGPAGGNTPGLLARSRRQPPEPCFSQVVSKGKTGVPPATANTRRMAPHDRSWTGPEVLYSPTSPPRNALFASQVLHCTRPCRAPVDAEPCRQEPPACVVLITARRKP